MFPKGGRESMKQAKTEESTGRSIVVGHQSSVISHQRSSEQIMLKLKNSTRVRPGKTTGTVDALLLLYTLFI